MWYTDADSSLKIELHPDNSGPEAGDKQELRRALAQAAISAGDAADKVAREISEYTIGPQRKRVEAILLAGDEQVKPGDSASARSVALPGDPLTPQDVASQQAVCEAYNKLKSLLPDGSLSSRDGLQNAVRAAFAAANNVALSALLAMNQRDYAALIEAGDDLTDDAFGRRLQELKDWDLEYRKEVWENAQLIWLTLRRGQRGEFVPTREQPIDSLDSPKHL